MSYPIGLAHGVCRFDKVWSDALEFDNKYDPKLDQLHDHIRLIFDIIAFLKTSATKQLRKEVSIWFVSTKT